MERRARAIWPGLANDIQCVQDVCVHCSCNAISQAAPPPKSSNPPATPFERIIANYFDYGGRHFFIIWDRFSAWADVFATVPSSSIVGAAALVCLLRTHFVIFIEHDEILTDGGPEFEATVTIEFFSTWGVNHRMSSAYFPSLIAELT